MISVEISYKYIRIVDKYIEINNIGGIDDRALFIEALIDMYDKELLKYKEKITV
ncbi:MAG: hypothetical protein LBC71_02455 [Oscillospiraceae bacterium]|jgi:hypothetical protein|nr:hypothetical protein [Oscillospiraceae bacterium]